MGMPAQLWVPHPRRGFIAAGWGIDAERSEVSTAFTSLATIARVPHPSRRDGWDVNVPAAAVTLTSTPMNHRTLGFASCTLASALWGCGFFFGKIALAEMNVGAMVRCV